MYTRPDRPLVVKCTFDRSTKRITFSSARNCTFDLLRHKCFSLYATAYNITYKDDDGEISDIGTDIDLTEAIQYFQEDDPPISSSSAASILSGRSFGSRRINLRVQISVDYDGPNLSDTSSLVSMEDYKNRSASHTSFSFGGPLSMEEGVDDDSVTVSSRDNGVSYTGRSLSGSPKDSTTTMTSDPSSLSSTTNHDSSYNQNNEDEADEAGPFSDKYRTEDRFRDSFASSSADPSAMLDELKRAAGRGNDADEENRGAAWLRDQNERNIRTALGAMPAPSESDSLSFSLSAGGSPDSDVDLDPEGEEDVRVGALALQRDSSGKYYYAYTAQSNDARSSMGVAAGVDDIIHHPHKPRITSMQLNWLRDQQVVAASPTPHTKARSVPSSHPRSAPSAPPSSSAGPSIHSDPLPARDPLPPFSDDIPPEVLRFLPLTGPPEDEITTCSVCGVLLDSIRYICATCGVKAPQEPVPEPSTPGSVVNGNGNNGHAADNASIYSGVSMTYPPAGHRSPPSYAGLPTSYSQSTIQSYSANSDRQYKPLPDIPLPSSENSHDDALRSFLARYPPPPPPPLPMLQPSYAPSSSSSSSSGSPSSSSSSYPHHHHHHHPFSSPNSSAGQLLEPHRSHSAGSVGPSSSSSSLIGRGYELCSGCIESAGVTHAIEAGITLLPSRDYLNGGGPSSPEELSQWRRSAPRQKGQLRHAYLEKVWGYSGWEDLQQDDGASPVPRCSTCNATSMGRRYKCISCQSFSLCVACYSQVHDLHPSHAFLIVPEKPQRSRSDSELPYILPADLGSEQELRHSGIKCVHCMLDIVGARFHCAICDSVDICSNCESAGLPGNLDSSDDGHNSSHIMIKIPFPLDTSEVETASRRAVRLWTGRDAASVASLPGGSRRRRRRGNSDSSSYAGTVIASRVGKRKVPGYTCNGCNKSIPGVRYQCANCPSLPSGFNLCAICEISSHTYHDPMHAFFKIPRPLDRQIESSFPILPVLYKIPVGSSSTPGGAGTPVSSNNNNNGNIDSTANGGDYLRNLIHSSAVCDRCMTRIQGAWFRCAYCAKDLCDVCEELDTHDDRHIFIVFKSPVEMQVFRRFTDLENPDGSPPLIPYPVFD